MNVRTSQAPSWADDSDVDIDDNNDDMDTNGNLMPDDGAKYVLVVTNSGKPHGEFTTCWNHK